MRDGKASVMSKNCNNVFSLFSFNNAQWMVLIEVAYS